MTEPTQAKRTHFGYKNAAALGVTVLAVAASIAFRQCHKPPTEPPAKCPDPIVCVQPDTTKCNPDIGMHDPISNNYDPKKCGYCGDGIAQPWEQPSWAKQIDPKKITCDVDFHCGDGVLNKKKTYGLIVPPVVKGGSYTVTDKTVTESCDPKAEDYCEADCPKTNAGPKGAAKGGPGPDDSSKVVDTTLPAPGGPCPEPNIGITALRVDMKDALDAKIESIRSAHKATSKAKIVASMTVPISASGKVGRPTTSSTCYGGTDNCPVQSVNATSIVGSASFVGDTINPPPRVDCSVTQNRPSSGG